MSDSFPEPSQVGPIVGGLRASDRDREQVVAVLSTAYAEGRLTRDEHDERLSQVMAAKTFDDLVPITDDLVVVAPHSGQPPVAPHAGYQVQTRAASQAQEHLVAIFGGVTRRGKWRIRKNTTAWALFGGIDLDLREAIFEDPVVEIRGLWCFGGMDIKVPPGVEVRDQVVGIFGGSDVSHSQAIESGAPTLVIKGLALFGGVAVKGPKVDRKRHGHR